MSGLDHLVESPDSTVALVLTVAVLLGLRHAADPDHLAAVSTLIAGDDEHDPRTAARLGVAWGLGHASTLCAFGLPVILVGAGLPPSARRAAEVAVGVVIIALAIRLLARWRRGRFHTHTHSHGGTTHRHLHTHAHATDHAHAHVTGLGRTRAQAYVIGLLHGVGGSAGAGVLLLASLPSPALGISALVLFALGTAVSMAAASLAFGYLITRGWLLRHAGRVTPLLGVFGAAFGMWYLHGALVS